MIMTHLRKGPIAAAFLLLAAVAAAPAVDPTMLNYVMPDARVVGGINVTTAMTSPFGQYLLSRIQTEDKDFQQFIDLTGFDPRRDLSEIVFASPGQHGQKTGMVVVRGTFQISKILALATQHNQTVTSYNGADVIINAHSGTDSGWVAFLNGSLALAGDTASVKGALDRRGASGLKADLSAQAQALSSRYQAWFLSTVPVNELTGRVPEVTGSAPAAPRGDFFQGVQQVSGGALFGTQVELSLNATTRSDRDAQALADVVRFLAGMVQQNQDKPEAANLAKILDTLDLKTAGPVTTITLSIPEADLEKLLQSKQPQAGGHVRRHRPGVPAPETAPAK